MSAIRPFNPFRSERLVYRAVNDTPEDEKFVHSIQKDAGAQSGASYGLLRPESVKASNEFKQHIAEKCLLGAIICLPASDPENDDTDEAGESIGIICLKSNPPHLAHHRWTDISIDIARNQRGRGYGDEAIQWSLWYAFQMRLGFQEEGRQRESMWLDGGWHDNVIYGMLEDEWRDMQRKAGKEV
ncbi:acyl-CoA N-acyltransferase [Hypoxylon sp. EC38]|nr:acyl-CoA N-acyltransferase [Hypoxylon sp. EC38]